MDIFSEREIIHSISNFKSSYRFSRWDSLNWDKLRFYHEYPENKFINQSLNDAYNGFVSGLNDLQDSTLGIMFTCNEKHWQYTEPDKVYTREELRDILSTQLYGMITDKYFSDVNGKAAKEFYDKLERNMKLIDDSCGKAIKLYHEFRAEIKRILFY